MSKNKKKKEDIRQSKINRIEELRKLKWDLLSDTFNPADLDDEKRKKYYLYCDEIQDIRFSIGYWD